jgi:hypothetical protein
MTTIHSRILLFIWLLGTLAVAQEPQLSKVPSLPAVTRGSTVKVTAKEGAFPKQGVKVYLRTGNERDGDNGTPTDAVVSDDGTSLSFKVPSDHFETGRYLVLISFDSKTLPVAGELQVLSDQSAKVKIDSISPATDYHSDSDNGFDFEISGENLGQVPTDNILEVVGQGPQAVGSTAECQKYAETHNYDKICLSYDPGMETRKLKVAGFHPAHYQGPVDFRVRVGNNVSEARRVMFSGTTESWLRIWAILVSVALAGIVLAVVWKGVSVCSTGECYGFLDSFFLDKETMSYSLSKFQLIAWTVVAVFGFVYVFFCRTLIQWNFSFPSIPSQWATLLGLSAGTTVAAVGITATRGSKGSGPPVPSFADFISTGGLVTSDRFQFFVWTLLGCFSFLMMIVTADPSALKDLPSVPEGFLFVMGISAAGYLGGKVVRLPGPVITQLLVESVTPAGNKDGKDHPASMVVRLIGENLSVNASVRVDDDQMRPDEFAVEEAKAQDQPADPSFRTEVKVTLKNADKYVDGQHKLGFINKDGQMAGAQFPVDPLTIESISLARGDTTIRVEGKNFEDNTTAEWRNPSTSAPVAAPVKKISDKQLEITVAPVTAGDGRLTLISAIRLRTSKTVQIP